MQADPDLITKNSPNPFDQSFEDMDYGFLKQNTAAPVKDDDSSVIEINNSEQNELDLINMDKGADKSNHEQDVAFALIPNSIAPANIRERVTLPEVQSQNITDSNKLDTSLPLVKLLSSSLAGRKLLRKRLVGLSEDNRKALVKIISAEMLARHVESA